MITYAYAPADEISYEVRKAAEMALAAARKELKLPMVRIKWFFKTEKGHNPYNPYAADDFDVFGLGTFTCEKDIRGQFRGAEPDVIFVMGGQSVTATKDTVYHEIFHLWQFKQGFGFADHSEGLAQGYTEDALMRMKLYGEDEQTYLEHMIGKDWSEKPNPEKPLKVPCPQENVKSGTTSGGRRGYHKTTYGRTYRTL